MNQTKMKQLSSFSEVATMLRFPLIIGVLFIHALPNVIQKMAITDVWNSPQVIWSYKYISELCSHAIPLIAVPLFFFISGYYTFFQKDWSKKKLIKAEWKKKLKGLVLPYFIWNTLMIVALLLWAKLSYLLGLEISYPLKITSLKQVFGYYTYDVINYPLWYLRELIILTILAPIIYRLLKVSNGWVLLIFLVLFLANIPLLPSILGNVSVFTFSLGGFLGMKKINPLELVWSYKHAILVITVLLVLFLPLSNSWAYHGYLTKYYILLGASSALILSHEAKSKRPYLFEQLKSLNRYVFFIYVAHAVLINYLVHALILRLPFVNPEADGALLGYFLTVLLTLMSTLVIYHILDRLQPRLLKFLCGSRS